jgi:hypothetical protein
MDAISFKFNGKEYQVEKIVRQELETGKDKIHIITKDNKRFTLVFNESIFKWVVAELIG